MNQGISVVECIENKNEKLLNMINLGKFVATCVTTSIHAKQWYVLKCRLHAEFTKEGLYAILDEMEALLKKEAANAEFRCAVDRRGLQTWLGAFYAVFVRQRAS